MHPLAFVMLMKVFVVVLAVEEYFDCMRRSIVNEVRDKEMCTFLQREGLHGHASVSASHSWIGMFRIRYWLCRNSIVAHCWLPWLQLLLLWLLLLPAL